MKFSEANSKIKKLYKVPELGQWLDNKRKIYSFDLLSGHSCPFAKDCLSKAVLIDGKRKIKDGKETQFRCFSASQEAQYDGPYFIRSGNFQAMRSAKGWEGKYNLLKANLPSNAGIIRIHVAGDFFNRDYLKAWAILAMKYPKVLFYAYTKSLQFSCGVDDVTPDFFHDPIDNFVLTASHGGRHDHLIDDLDLRSAKVVFSKQEAIDKGLEIDSDDSHAARPDLRFNDFALLIHGTQPKGSDAGKALQLLRKEAK